MAGTNPNTLTGFVRRWKPDPSTMLDTSTGFRTGVSDTITAAGAMKVSTGKWAVSDGTALDMTQYTGGGSIGGMSTAYVGGPGLCAYRSSTNGKAPGMQAIEGTAGNRFTPDAFTIIVALRSPIGNAATDGAGIAPANIQTTDCGIITANDGGPHSVSATIRYNRLISVAASIAGTPSSLDTTIHLMSGRELVAFVVDSGTLKIGILRGAATVWRTATPGTFDSQTLGFMYFGLTGGGLSWRGIWEDVTLCKAGNSQANVEAAMTYIRDDLFARTGETFVTPTIQLDIITDSIGAGYGTNNGETWPAHLDAELRKLGVIVNHQSINGSDTQTWNDTTVMANFFDATPAYSTITKRYLLCHLGHNALAPTAIVAATWIADYNGLIAKWKALTSGTLVWGITPTCRSMDAAPGTTETARRTYVTAMRASASFTGGVINLDTLAPDLVPASTAAADVCYCGGSHYYQTADNNQHPGAQVAGITATGGWRKVDTAKTITGITNASPPVVTTSGNHTFVEGEQVTLAGIVGAASVLNGTTKYVHVVTAGTFSLYNDVAITTPTAAPGAYTSGGTATVPGNTLTKLGAFAGYTWLAGDILDITAGTGFSLTVPYIAGGKTNNNSILVTDIAGGLLTYADTADVTGFIIQRRDGLQIGGSRLFNGRQIGLDGLHPGNQGHLRMFSAIAKPLSGNTFPAAVGLAPLGGLLAPVLRGR